MQLRRETTCVAAMRQAMDGGDYATALVRAKELEQLDPSWSDVRVMVEERVRATQAAGAARRAHPSPIPAATGVVDARGQAPGVARAPRRRRRAAAAAVLLVVLAAVAGWAALRAWPWIATPLRQQTGSTGETAAAPPLPAPRSEPEIPNLPPIGVGPSPATASPAAGSATAQDGKALPQDGQERPATEQAPGPAQQESGRVPVPPTATTTPASPTTTTGTTTPASPTATTETPTTTPPPRTPGQALTPPTSPPLSQKPENSTAAATALSGGSGTTADSTRRTVTTPGRDATAAGSETKKQETPTAQPPMRTPQAPVMTPPPPPSYSENQPRPSTSTSTSSSPVGAPASSPASAPPTASAVDQPQTRPVEPITGTTGADSARATTGSLSAPPRTDAASGTQPPAVHPPASAANSNASESEARFGTHLPSPSASAVELDEQRAINRTLNAYEQGYTAMDASAVRRVWPRVNAEALKHAFDQLDSQRVSFEGCSIDVRGLHAAATCRGTATYVPKVGDGSPVSMQRTWEFALRKFGDGWLIDAATSR